MERWALYIRKSNEDGENSDTLTQQREQVEAFAQKYGYYYEPSDIYIETVSGKEPIQNRTELLKLLNKIELYTGIICRDVDRISRDMTTGAQILEIIRSHKKRLLYSSSNREANLQSSYTIGAELIGFMMASGEAEQITTRLTAGKNSKTEAGAFVGSFPPFGYDKAEMEIFNGTKTVKMKTLKPNKDSEIVKYIYNQRQAGAPIQRIAKDLSEMNVQSPRGTGWSDTTVRHILTNPVYVGYVVYGQKRVQTVHEISENGEIKRTKKRKDTGTAVRAKGLHDPIITEVQFEAVQTQMKTRPHTSTGKQTNPMSGLLYCYGCCHALTRQQGRGSRRPRYTHRTDGRPWGCFAPWQKSIREDELINLIIRQLEEDLAGIRAEVKPEEAKGDSGAVVGILQDEKAKAETERNDIIDLINTLEMKLLKTRKDGKKTDLIQYQLQQAEGKFEKLHQKIERIDQQIETKTEENKEKQTSARLGEVIEVGIPYVKSIMTDPKKLQEHSRAVNSFLKSFIRRIEVHFRNSSILITYIGSEDPDREHHYQTLRQQAQGKAKR